VEHQPENISNAFIVKVKGRYNHEVFHDRVDILVDLLRPDYDKDNVSKQAVVDVAKRYKVHYFLSHDPEKLVRRVIRKF